MTAAASSESGGSPAARYRCTKSSTASSSGRDSPAMSTKYVGRRREAARIVSMTFAGRTAGRTGALRRRTGRWRKRFAVSTVSLPPNEAPWRSADEGGLPVAAASDRTRETLAAGTWRDEARRSQSSETVNESDTVTCTKDTGARPAAAEEEHRARRAAASVAGTSTRKSHDAGRRTNGGEVDITSVSSGRTAAQGPNTAAAALIAASVPAAAAAAIDR